MLLKVFFILGFIYCVGLDKYTYCNVAFYIVECDFVIRILFDLTIL